MRKISHEFEHPVDNLFIDGSEKLSSTFKTLGLTPNMITFISLIFGILAIYCLCKDNIIGFALAYLASHFFDCMDGHYARKYRMTSKFGDYFDHVKDAIVFIGILVVFIAKFRGCLVWYEWILVGAIVAIAAFGMARQLGCQERHYAATSKIEASERSDTLSAYAKLCKGDDITGQMRSRRWLGCANFILVVVIVVGTAFVAYKCRTPTTNSK